MKAKDAGDDEESEQISGSGSQSLAHKEDDDAFRREHHMVSVGG